MPTHTVPSSATPEETLAEIDAFAGSLTNDAAREALETLARTLRSGNDVVMATSDDAVTTSAAAKMLGVSRAHLYKVLDSGALPFTVVGKRDRRIAMSDLAAFIDKTEEARKSAARSVARRRDSRALSLDEMD
ncbi:DNA binding domain-containing protein, excisionase family [Brevibacterium sandarakinum]|uniref:DNA binding domain-containing protein, excisionase family n=1 Tax=Brevibacterium sandarakinum TaxID=629680 RepID=A0A1H1PPA1_BRESA|nr:helix-turn-helix domain-containing protein [Brevibacterium sandarakinum]SDS13132.1 DNA binding domain-containing protein, excisionase family [Brevibacterium sandarakinum]